MNIQPNIFWFFVCGLLWGVSLVMPGMSSSSLLIFMGLYEPMAAGIASLSMECLIPMGIGALLLIFVAARGINNLFKKHYAVAFHAILGFVIASTLVIIPTKYNGTKDIIFSIIAVALGFIVSWLMDKLSAKYKIED